MAFKGAWLVLFYFHRNFLGPSASCSIRKLGLIIILIACWFYCVWSFGWLIVDCEVCLTKKKKIKSFYILPSDYGMELLHFSPFEFNSNTGKYGQSNCNFSYLFFQVGEIIGRFEKKGFSLKGNFRVDKFNGGLFSDLLFYSNRGFPSWNFFSCLYVSMCWRCCSESGLVIDWDDSCSIGLDFSII